MSKRKHGDDSHVPQAKSPKLHPTSQHAQPLTAGRVARSYADANPNPSPEGPYSYTTEKRQTLYYSGAAAEEREGPPLPRPRKDAKRERPLHNDTFGQINAFPEPKSRHSTAGARVSDDISEGSASDGEGQAAWTYLRSVRQEAEALPSIFRKSSSAVREAQPVNRAESLGPHDGNDGDHEDYKYAEEDNNGAFYYDGAWVAGPTKESVAETSRRKTAQDLYYDAVTRRFSAHRKKVREMERGSGAPASKETIADLFKGKIQAHGRPSLTLLGPPSVRTAGSVLDTTTVLELLRILDEDVGHYANKKKGIPVVLGQWAWLLLGKLGDVGELGSEEVSVVRELGKRAGLALCRIRVSPQDDTALAAQHEDSGTDSERQTAMEQAGSTGEGLESSMAATQTLLHFIITVAGDFYGQRDLLDSRLAWEET